MAGGLFVMEVVLVINLRTTDIESVDGIINHRHRCRAPNFGKARTVSTSVGGEARRRAENAALVADVGADALDPAATERR